MERTWDAARLRRAGDRPLSHFLTRELPGVPLTVTVAGTSVEAVTDSEGYFLVRVPTDPEALVSPWSEGVVELRGDYPGTTGSHAAPGPPVRVVPVQPIAGRFRWTS